MIRKWQMPVMHARVQIPLLLLLGVIAVVRPAHAMDSYDQTDNINNYLKTSNTALTGADREYYEAMAVMECGAIMAMPNYVAGQTAFLEKTSDKNITYKVASLNRLNSRCADFAQNTTLKNYNIQSLLVNAERAGSIKASAYNLQNSLMGKNNLNPSEITDKVASILLAKDPEATLGMSSALGVMGPFQKTLNGEVGSNVSEYAWGLVACDEGLECGRNSALVILTCINRSICGPGDYQSNLQYSLPSSKYERVELARKNIESALASGSVKSLLVVRKNPAN